MIQQPRTQYSQAVKGDNNNDNFLEEKRDSSGSILDDIKTVNNIKKCKDPFEKITCIVEGILEIFE